MTGEAAPADAVRQLQLGAELMGQRRFADALESFRRADALGARGFDVDFGLGSALLDTGQEAAAIVALERAAALQPRHIGVDGAPEAELLVKNRTMEAECNRVSLLQRFTELGVDPARITLEGGAPHYDYLVSYSRVDVALDSFPYSGGTTTSEALWQGVPVLCIDGDRWAARQGASLLRAAGLDEFVAHDEADYIARGVQLGRGFADDRMTMRTRLAASSMMDTKAFAHEMESIYRRLAGLEVTGP